MSTEMYLALAPINKFCRLTGVTLTNLKSAGFARTRLCDWLMFILYLLLGVGLQTMAFWQQVNAIEGGCDLLDCYVGTALIVISCCIVTGAFISAAFGRKKFLEVNEGLVKINADLHQIKGTENSISKQQIKKFTYILIILRLICGIIIISFDGILTDTTKWAVTLQRGFSWIMELSLISYLLIYLYVLSLELSKINHIIHKEPIIDRRMLKLHDTACDIVELLNSAFHWYLVVKNLYAFTYLLYFVFFMATRFWIAEILSIAYEIVRTIDILIDIGLLVLHVNFLISQVNKSVNILIEMRFHYSNFSDQMIMTVLRLKKRQLEVTAFHFFPIDCTILYSIVAGVTTYFVYLLQFSTV